MAVGFRPGNLDVDMKRQTIGNKSESKRASSHCWSTYLDNTPAMKKRENLMAERQRKPSTNVTTANSMSTLNRKS